jgi:hypothetical protein
MAEILGPGKDFFLKKFSEKSELTPNLTPNSFEISEQISVCLHGFRMSLSESKNVGKMKLKTDSAVL